MMQNSENNISSIKLEVEKGDLNKMYGLLLEDYARSDALQNKEYKLLERRLRIWQKMSSVLIIGLLMIIICLIICFTIVFNNLTININCKDMELYNLEKDISLNTSD